MERVERRKKKKKKKVMLIFGTFITIFLCLVGYYGYTLMDGISAAHDENLKTDAQKVNVKEEPFTILLIGMDRLNLEQEKKDGWRPDVLMLTTVNPKDKSVRTMSIPRDILVKYYDSQSKGKITDTLSVLPKGSDEKSKNQQIVKQVEQFLDNKIEINYVAQINFRGFMDLVEAVGGIQVDNKYAFKAPFYGGEILKYEKGPIELDGKKALMYVRTRKSHPGARIPVAMTNDNDRNRRQQEVITAILDKMIGFTGLTQFSEITNAVGKNFRYSFDTDEIIPLFNVYRDAQNNKESIILYNYPKRYSGSSVQILPEGERQRALAELLKHMGKEYDEHALLYDHKLDPQVRAGEANPNEQVFSIPTEISPKAYRKPEPDPNQTNNGTSTDGSTSTNGGSSSNTTSP